MKLDFIMHQNSGGLIQEIRMKGLAKSSKTINLKCEHGVQYPLCSNYDAVVVQSNTTASSVINQHSDDYLDDNPCHENREHSDYVLVDHLCYEHEASVYREGGRPAAISVEKSLQ